MHLFKDIVDAVSGDVLYKPSENSLNNEESKSSGSPRKNIEEVPDDFLITKVMNFRYEEPYIKLKKKRDENKPKIVEEKIKDTDLPSASTPVKNIECFADFIILIYENETFFDIFKKSGKLIERRHIAGKGNSDIN